MISRQWQKEFPEPDQAGTAFLPLPVAWLPRRRRCFQIQKTIEVSHSPWSMARGQKSEGRAGRQVQGVHESPPELVGSDTSGFSNCVR